MIEVRLDEVEAFHAAICGVMRRLQGIYEHKKHSAGATDEELGWSSDVESAAGEVAAARAYNRYYDFSVGTFRTRGDVGDIQVRSTVNHDSLIVRPYDSDEDWFVLVTGSIPVFKVWGHIRGSDAKQPVWLREYGNRPPAYFVPKEALCPLNKK